MLHLPTDAYKIKKWRDLLFVLFAVFVLCLNVFCKKGFIMKTYLFAVFWFLLGKRVVPVHVRD